MTTEEIQIAIGQRQQLWNTMVINQEIVSLKGTLLIPNVQAASDKIVLKILQNKSRYLNVAHSFPNPGLQWWLISIIHYMECNLNFNCYLGNGQPINQVTTIVPKNRGPFQTFEDGAIDAIELKGFNMVTDWSLGNVLFILEGFNGYGYPLYHRINSPYLWSGTNQYIAGDYVKDGIFDPDVVSQEIGSAILLKKLLNQ